MSKVLLKHYCFFLFLNVKKKMEESFLDFSNITKEQVKEYCMVESRNCISIGRMLLLLGGSKSQLNFYQIPMLRVQCIPRPNKILVYFTMSSTSKK